MAKKKKYAVTVLKDRCKECGICIEFCPQKVFDRGPDEKSEPARVEDCIGCMLCQYRCPDFAVWVEEEGGEEDGEN